MKKGLIVIVGLLVILWGTMGIYKVANAWDSDDVLKWDEMIASCMHPEQRIGCFGYQTGIFELMQLGVVYGVCIPADKQEKDIIQILVETVRLYPKSGDLPTDDWAANIFYKASKIAFPCKGEDL